MNIRRIASLVGSFVLLVAMCFPSCAPVVKPVAATLPSTKPVAERPPIFDIPLIDSIKVDDDPSAWGMSLSDASLFAGDLAGSRSYAEKAREALERQLRDAPDDPQRHVILGLALARLGRKEDAIREGRRGVELMPMSRDAPQAAYAQHQLARIYISVGEPEKALDQLEPLLKIPYYLTPAWLKIDPNFDPLRSNPRFQKLVAGAK